jgi:hypothetical protein
MSWNEWNIIRNRELPREARIVIRDQDAHCAVWSRRQRFLLYVPFPTVGQYIDAYGALMRAGIVHSDADRNSGLSDINWDLDHDFISLEEVPAPAM